jgi:hypothetical protein
MHDQGNHPNGLRALKLRILAWMAFFGQDRVSKGQNLSLLLLLRHHPTGLLGLTG